MGKKKPSQKTKQRRVKKSKNNRAGAIQRTVEIKRMQEKAKKEFIDKLNAQRMQELEKRKQDISSQKDIIEGDEIGDVGDFALDDDEPSSEEVPLSNEEIEEFTID